MLITEFWLEMSIATAYLWWAAGLIECDKFTNPRNNQSSIEFELNQMQMAIGNADSESITGFTCCSDNIRRNGNGRFNPNQSINLWPKRHRPITQIHLWMNQSNGTRQGFLSQARSTEISSDHTSNDVTDGWPNPVTKPSWPIFF